MKFARRGNFRFVVIEDGRKVTVKMISPACGIKGISICHENDEYKFSSGLSIAIERAIKNYQGTALEYYKKKVENVKNITKEALTCMENRYKNSKKSINTGKKVSQF
jgi:hypothetical protein